MKCDVEGIIINLNQIGDRAVRGIAEVMRKESREIQELARVFAPIDEGNLEEAIKINENRNGVNRRLGVSVYVDGAVSAPRRGKDGQVIPSSQNRTVGDYALLMHEGLAPYGTGLAGYLGPLSLAKDGGSGRVGGKYLERALNARYKILMAEVLEIVRRSIR